MVGSVTIPGFMPTVDFAAATVGRLLVGAAAPSRPELHGYAAGVAAMRGMALPAAAQPSIQDIGNMADPEQRNRLITGRYHQLSQQMGEMLGPDAGANWATWASWASARAGQTIRGDDLPISNNVRQLGAFLTGPFGMTLNSQYERARSSVAEGNNDVFKDIAPHYQRFIDAFKGDQHPDEAKWQQFSRQFRNDQGALRDGFRAYYDAMFERDPKKKQELTLMGNLQCALHEQRRLDPIINEALPSLPGRIVSQLMSMQLPGESLSLGSDVPPLGGRAFPTHLQSIQTPALRQFLAQWDRTPNTLQGSGVSNWANLADRMNYICDLFRSRHRQGSLLTQRPT